MMRRIYVTLYKWVHKPISNPISRQERYVIMTALRLMKSKETEFILHPSKDRFYIQSDLNKMMLVIDKYPENVTLVNHKYSYDIRFSTRAMNFLLDKFVEATECRREIFEKSFMRNTEDSLQNIYQSVIL